MKSMIVTEDKVKELHEQKAKTLITESLQIYETKYAEKYPGLGRMFNNPVDEMIAAQTVALMENQSAFMEQAKSNLGEAVIRQKFGQLATRTLDVLRIAYPNFIGHEIIDMQVMKSPADLVFVIKPVYSQARADVSAGQDLFTSAQAASEETLDSVGTGNGANTDFTKTLTYKPVRPETVFILKDGQIVGQDDGKGKIVNYSSGTQITEGADSEIDYVNGIVKVKFASAPALGVEITCQYYFDSEQSPDYVTGVDLVFSTIPVTARAHKLRLKWSVDAALVAAHSLGIDVEDSLSIAAGQEFKSQRDLAILNDLIRAAGPVKSALTFNATVPSGVPEVEHAQGFRRILGRANNEIYTPVGRGQASWFIVGTDVEEYMSYLPNYIEEPNPIPIGIHRVGTYKGRPVYKSKNLPAAEFLSGFKGNMFGDAGYILAEFIELYTTPTIEMDDLMGRKGLLSMYDKKLITAGYYVRGKINNLS